MSGMRRDRFLAIELPNDIKKLLSSYTPKTTLGMSSVVCSPFLKTQMGI